MCKRSKEIKEDQSITFILDVKPDGSKENQRGCNKTSARTHRGSVAGALGYMNINNPFKMDASHTRELRLRLITTQNLLQPLG